MANLREEFQQKQSAFSAHNASLGISNIAQMEKLQTVAEIMDYPLNKSFSVDVNALQHFKCVSTYKSDFITAEATMADNLVSISFFGNVS